MSQFIRFLLCLIIKIIVLSIFLWLFYTGFTVYCKMSYFDSQNISHTCLLQCDNIQSKVSVASLFCHIHFQQVKEHRIGEHLIVLLN